MEGTYEDFRITDKKGEIRKYPKVKGLNTGRRYLTDLLNFLSAANSTLAPGQKRFQ